MRKEVIKKIATFDDKIFIRVTIKLKYHVVVTCRCPIGVDGLNFVTNFSRNILLSFFSNHVTLLHMINF